MKLTQARVINYRSIDDSSWVRVDDVTALVGKNESGKTAFLQAIRKINSISGEEDTFDIRDYPRKGYIKYKKIHDQNPCEVAQAEFELNDEEISEIEANFGNGILASNKVIVTKNYKNERNWKISLAESIAQPLNMTTFTQPATPAPTSFQSAVQSVKDVSNVSEGISEQFLEKWLPKFVYFDNYSLMRGKISINELRQRAENGGPFDDADRTFLSLLTLSGVSLKDLEKDLGYEDIKVELESASITITDEIFEYWQQNRQLKVEFDVSQADPRDAAPLNQGKILHVRIENARHRVTVSFDERSKGFVWFFSFLSYFSHLEETENGDLIILLDEPGTALHAMAQKDFLRFMDERLSPRCQVLYTTHSPFMIDLEKLHRIRLVQDMDGVGTVVSDDPVNNDKETVFPLQMALGYQMAQTLFLSPHCLMVNSPSDLIYLQVLGDMVAAESGIRIDPRWVIIPVGRTDNLSTFLTLLGDNYVSVAVMMDLTLTNKEKIEAINRKNELEGENPVKWVQVSRVRDADIEDLFEPKIYLELVNLSYANQLEQTLTMRSITESNPRIVERLKAYFAKTGTAGGVFDRYVPAAYLLENFEDFKVHISEDSIQKAKTLVERINSLITEAGSIDTLNSSKRGGSRTSRAASNKSDLKGTGVVDFKSLQSSVATGSLPLQTQF
ncbi:MAG: ATPase/GTPase, AAA15 family [Chloroflexi bacterium]|jgi:predicted ATP-dependent endonuclease of OLD family|nr:MAG: ATPase/GTPase, AAA15 family [Chloroflexota bacterium]